MEAGKERRTHERHRLKLDIFCQTVGLAGGRFYGGNTIDVSPSGVLAEINEPGLGVGQLISVDMPVPPTQGLLDYGGRFSGYARVVRIKDHQEDGLRRSDSIQAIALEFCQSPKLQV